MKGMDRGVLRIAWTAISVLSFFCSSASAHHATAAEYDTSKTVTLKGTITRVDWVNPHIHVYIETKERGVARQWDVEFPSPGGTIVAGLSRQILAVGTVLTFEGLPAKPDFRPNPRKNSTPGEPVAAPQQFACATAITLSDGSRIKFVVGV